MYAAAVDIEYAHVGALFHPPVLSISDHTNKTTLCEQDSGVSRKLRNIMNTIAENRHCTSPKPPCAPKHTQTSSVVAQMTVSLCVLLRGTQAKTSHPEINQAMEPQSGSR